jgi:hypothetical protein
MDRVKDCYTELGCGNRAIAIDPSPSDVALTGVLP